MEYKVIELNSDVAVGKTFEFPTEEIQTIDYGKYYGEVCNNLHPTKSFGIYEVGMETTKFTVAVQTPVETSYEMYKIPSGTYFEFEIDMLENQKSNQYVKCFEALEAAGEEFDMTYSVEIMDRNFNPLEGKYKFKYYLKQK